MDNLTNPSFHNKYNREERMEIKNHFLNIPDEFLKYVNNSNIIWIYSISSIRNNHVVYIGKTTDITRRASQYVAEYSRKEAFREINALLLDNGIENYIMTPIDVTFSDMNGSELELYYIRKYDTISNGVNTAYGSRGTILKPTDANNKRSRSKLICIVSPNSHDIIICTGLKLAGDIIGRTKDMMKTYAKRGLPVDGYYIYYLNYIDYNMIIDKVNNKLVNTPLNAPHYNPDLYRVYLHYAKYLKTFLKSKGHKNPEHFVCKYATQVDNNSGGYEFEDIDNFLREYKNFTLKIYN